MRLLVLVGCVPLLVGCAHLESAERAAAPRRWIELRSPHFVLRTDLKSREARAALVEYERTYGALQSLAFPGDPPREPIDLVVFRDEEEFRGLAPEGATGYFMPRQLEESDPQPTIAMFGQLSDVSQRRFTHELTHRFVDHRMEGEPPWVAEGLAEYYSTLRIDGDDLVVGSLPNSKLFRVDVHLSGALSGRYVDNRVELSAVPPLRELLAADERTFHEPAREAAFYAASWTLVHMIEHGRFGYLFKFTRYLDAMAKGVAPADAWEHEFADVDMQHMEDQFRGYLVKLFTDERTLRWPAPASARPEGERRLRDDELHLLLARIRPWDSRESILAAGHELDQAQALAGDGGTPELHYWRGLYAARWRRFAVAERELGRALAVEPRSARYWLALAELLARPDRGDGGGPRLDDAVTHLAPIATSLEAVTFVARYYSERGDAEHGLPFARRAAQLVPGCRACADTLSALRSLLRPESDRARDVYMRPGIR